jgi:hypothetical protein
LQPFLFNGEAPANAVRTFLPKRTSRVFYLAFCAKILMLTSPLPALKPALSTVPNSKGIKPAIRFFWFISSKAASQKICEHCPLTLTAMRNCTLFSDRYMNSRLGQLTNREKLSTQKAKVVAIIFKRLTKKLAIEAASL